MNVQHQMKQQKCLEKKHNSRVQLAHSFYYYFASKLFDNEDSTNHYKQ